MTVWSFLTVLVRVSSTVAPETATPVTALAELSVVTAKSEVVAVVEEREWRQAWRGQG